MNTARECSLVGARELESRLRDDSTHDLGEKIPKAPKSKNEIS